MLVIFDCDGVLIDSEIVAARLEAEAITELGLPMTAEDICRRFAGTTTREVWATLERELGRPLPAGFFETHLAHVREVFSRELEAITGARAAVESVAATGTGYCVASSTQLASLITNLGTAGLVDLFDGNVFSASQVKRAKPAPDVFLFAASQMGADPADCVVVEDSVAGVTAARRAGMPVVGFVGGSHVTAGHDERLRARGAGGLIEGGGALGGTTMTSTSIDTPPISEFLRFTDPVAAVDRLVALYEEAIGFLARRFADVAATGRAEARIRAFYPEIRLSIDTHARLDSRLAFGYVQGPGHYATTVTRPDLFRRYLTIQIEQLIANHGVPVEIGSSDLPIPLHFALSSDVSVAYDVAERIGRPIRDVFDVPDLAVTDDAIVNGTWTPRNGEAAPLAPFTAPRVDYSLARLQHYTATRAEHFQNYVLFTNYQFYIDEFIAHARRMLADPASGFEAFVEPGNVVWRPGASEPSEGVAPPRLPQMPAYHLVRPGHAGLTMVNIGVGPSNAKTITDHVAVLRPHAWVMLGHCAGLRNTQRLGDYVLAHAYVRDDHVLDADLPPWVPIPALAEIQVALEQAVAEITGLSGFALKSVMRTGTVATIDNRNWELRDQQELVERFSQSRAIALDMESATIAANGFRFRVPYGTLLCVSDKPLQGELKLPGMASEFYRRQVGQHLEIGIRAMEKLRSQPAEKIHSRKLRSFEEVAFQ